MMEVEYKNAKRAYEKYSLDQEYKIAEKVLEYVRKRIDENKEEIERILKLYKRDYRYEEIKKVIDEEIEEEIEYKKQINLLKREDNFVSTKYLNSIGIVCVECYDTLDSIRYMIRAIKTRNAIILSDVEYEETDEKHIVLMIIQEALKNFGVDKNIIQIIPYEECDYKKCDKVIFTYSGKDSIEKRYEDKEYIYVEEEAFIKEAKIEYDEEKRRGKMVVLVGGSIDEAIEKINECVSKGAVIYTKNSDIAYKFVNLVKSENVFVNATLQNIEQVKKSSNELLMNKKIMYELRK